MEILFEIFFELVLEGVLYINNIVFKKLFGDRLPSKYTKPISSVIFFILVILIVLGFIIFVEKIFNF